MCIVIYSSCVGTILLKVILDSEIFKGLKYNKATPIFHQWRDYTRRVYGLKFESSEDADGFANAILAILDPAAFSKFGMLLDNCCDSYIF